jgi:hypothetical protein
MQITPLIATLNHFSTMNATVFCREISKGEANNTSRTPLLHWRSWHGAAMTDEVPTRFSTGEAGMAQP